MHPRSFLRCPLSGSPVVTLLTLVAFNALAASSLAQNQKQFDPLDKQMIPRHVADTRAMATGDVDGDGDLDLIVANARQQNRLYLNDGNGVYRIRLPPDALLPMDTDQTEGVAVGDVDSDGDLDIVFGNARSGFNSGEQNRLYLNDGNGSFTDATSSRLPMKADDTGDVALADIDGDGDIDIVLGNSGQNGLYVNDGSGTFTDASSTRMPRDNDYTEAVALGDVDNDGDIDIITGNLDSVFGVGQPNRLYLNDGSGSFSLAVGIPGYGDDTEDVALGDVDGDGYFDIVVANRDEALGNGQQNRLYINDGTGRFRDATTNHLPALLDETGAASFGDVNGDGNLDILFGNKGGTYQGTRIYLNNGNGLFAGSTHVLIAREERTQALLIADFDADSDLDVVAGNRDRNRLYFNDGQGVVEGTASRIPSASHETPAMALGDVDSDGDADILFGESSAGGNASLLLNNGLGSFSDATAARMPGKTNPARTLVTGDVDGDGGLDIIVGTSGQDELYMNDGRGHFSDGTSGRMPPNTGTTDDLAVGDVDGDGDLDIVCSQGTGDRLYTNDGTGAFSDATSARMPTTCSSNVALGDVDGDGDLDMILGSFFAQTRILINDGTGVFTDVTVRRMVGDKDGTTDLALGDLDGDGDLDIVLGNRGSIYPDQQNRIYLNDGSGRFSDATATHMPGVADPTSAVALGDIDGDGDLDLFVGEDDDHESGRTNRLLLNDGSGRFTDVSAKRLPPDRDDTLCAAFGDLDEDGDQDIAFGNRGQQNRLYLNRHRQLHAPLLLRPGMDYVLDAYARPDPGRATEFALPYYSTVPASLTVPPYGTLRLSPADLVALPLIIVAQPSGVGSITIPVPNTPALRGVEFHIQALQGPNRPQARFTNAIADTLR